MNQKRKDLIQALELELLKPEVRKSAEKLNELLADDFLEYARNGKKYNKQEMIEALIKSPRQVFSANNFEAKEIAANTILLTYIVDREIIQSKQKNRTLCSSIWQKRETKWQMIFFQGTPAYK